ncbi:MAG TPA: hypothetical protein VFF62_01925 [Candidatus Nitrosocosmicus sp.]|jgi:hypothetical protein|nr:hypothetical protein [Candidatus Nitrosocosmicus sp.]
MPRYLFIVAKEHPELCAHLEREFVGEDGVRVMLDRRGTERRRIRGDIPDADRRRSDRRSNPGLQQELAALNFALVRAE